LHILCLLVYLTFDENAYVFKEDGNEAKLNLSLSRPLRRNITVNFMFRDLSAIGNLCMYVLCAVSIISDNILHFCTYVHAYIRA